MVLEVVVVYRADVLGWDGFVDVLAGDDRCLVEEGFLQDVWDPFRDACGRESAHPPDMSTTAVRYLSSIPLSSSSLPF